MDDERRRVLDLLCEDARYTAEDVARQLDLTTDEVAAHVEALENAGAVRGYTAVVDWAALDDGIVEAKVELNVELDRETGYEDISRRIAKFPEVTAFQLVSGDYDFALEVRAETMNDVSQFVSEEIAPIPEVTQTVTHYVMETYKADGIEFDDGETDDRLSYSP
ncbi:leucine responsive regulatory protein [Halarchaeum acidiphilum MH1-52-1]|uniref:Leucine responsive regulatory protein n=1 Tax=Halarchaeum acidiphilum MH1-52-1 TaxID=1261545 RepID=U2YWP8_9EURY|nr:Lrp/AsnC family transcriptional regulator [Halarchaeum acidiphilum]GAD53217.1 leucine responsive regulatory protein [Halarchaeum acidiphilum MH1-52-1]